MATIFQITKSYYMVINGNNILWPSRYCSSPNLLASWCAAMTAMTVQLAAVIGKAARAQRREGPRVPYASQQISPWGRNWTNMNQLCTQLDVSFMHLGISHLSILSLNGWCWLVQRSSQESTMKKYSTETMTIIVNAIFGAAAKKQIRIGTIFWLSFTPSTDLHS